MAGTPRHRTRIRRGLLTSLSDSSLAVCAALLLLIVSRVDADFTVPCDEGLISERADAGRPRGGRFWQKQHNGFVEAIESKASQVNMVVYGDSITEDLSEMNGALEVYRQDYRMEALGIGGDRTSNLLWRIQNGEFPKGMSPQFVVIHIGINNVLSTFEDEGTLDNEQEDELAELIEADVRDIVALIHQESCRTQIMIQAVFPTAWETDNEWPNLYTDTIDKANRLLSRMAESYSNTHFMDCSNIFLEKSGSRQRIRTDRMDDLLHPTEEGHKALAKCVLEYSHKAFRGILEQSTSLVFHEWGECSAPCGGGYHIRDSDCKLETDFIVGIDSDLSTRIGKEACNRIPVNGRDLVQACNTEACPTTPPPVPSTPQPKQSEATRNGRGSGSGVDERGGQTSPGAAVVSERPPVPSSPLPQEPKTQRTPSLADWFSMLSSHTPTMNNATVSTTQDIRSDENVAEEGADNGDDGTDGPEKGRSQSLVMSNTPNEEDTSRFRTSQLVDMALPGEDGDEFFRDVHAEGEKIPEFVIISVVAICTCVFVTLCGGAIAYVCYVRRLSQERQRLLEDSAKEDCEQQHHRAPAERESGANAQHNLKWRRVTEETLVMSQIIGAHQGV